MDNNNYISSKVLIAELYQDYKIESHDFVGRFPNWCYACLRELGVYQATTIQEKQDCFNEYKYMLPYDCQGVIQVTLNNKIAKDIRPKSLSYQGFRTDPFNDIIQTPQQQEERLDIKDNGVFSPTGFRDSIDTGRTYYPENGWLHFNIEFGFISIKYNAVPCEYDSDTNMVYPLIYNEELLKKAIKLYVLKQMLLRGYSHNLLNLRDNNPFTNPGLEYEQIRYRVRTACNKFSSGRREDIKNILSKW